MTKTYDAPKQLTESDRWDLINGMNAASAFYTQIAQAAKETGTPSLAAQFERQAEQATALAMTLEAEEIIVIGDDD